jgi:hypothetical protein
MIMLSMRVVIATLCIVACTPAPADTTAAAPEAQTADPAPAKPEPQAHTSADSNVITAATLVGRWGDNGDCTRDIVFNADGSFASYTGGAGRWTLNGDRITITGSAGSFEVRAQRIGENQLMIQNADGSFGVSQRC